MGADMNSIIDRISVSFSYNSVRTEVTGFVRLGCVSKCYQLLFIMVFVEQGWGIHVMNVLTTRPSTTRPWQDRAFGHSIATTDGQSHLLAHLRSCGGG